MTVVQRFQETGIRRAGQSRARLSVRAGGRRPSLPSRAGTHSRAGDSARLDGGLRQPLAGLRRAGDRPGPGRALAVPLLRETDALRERRKRERLLDVSPDAAGPARPRRAGRGRRGADARTRPRGHGAAAAPGIPPARQPGVHEAERHLRARDAAAPPRSGSGRARDPLLSGQGEQAAGPRDRRPGRGPRGARAPARSGTGALPLSRRRWKLGQHPAGGT